MERQAILDRERPPELWVVIDEAVLHRRVGGAAVAYQDTAVRGQVARNLPGAAAVRDSKHPGARRWS
jgi:hypothetical protein